MILAEDELAIGTEHAGIMVLETQNGLAPGTPLEQVLPIATDVLEESGLKLAEFEASTRERIRAAQPEFGRHDLHHLRALETLGMSGRRLMVEACRMGEQQRRHAIPWRENRAFREAANLGGHYPLGKSRSRCEYGFAIQFNRRMRSALATGLLA